MHDVTQVVPFCIAGTLKKHRYTIKTKVSCLFRLLYIPEVTKNVYGIIDGTLD